MGGAYGHLVAVGHGVRYGEYIYILHDSRLGESLYLAEYRAIQIVVILPQHSLCASSLLALARVHTLC
jgi:hypothetical protein